jgi:hypothetical protein
MSQPKGRLVASKSSLQKLQDAVVGTVKGVVKDPVGSAGKAVQQAKGTFAVGKAVAGQVARSATARANGAKGTRAPGPARTTVTPTTTSSPAPAAAPERDVVITPADVARVVEKKSPAEKAAAKKAPAKKAPAKKAPAKKAASSPSGKLPPPKAPPAKKAPAKKSAGDGDS